MRRASAAQGPYISHFFKNLRRVQPLLERRHRATAFADEPHQFSIGLLLNRCRSKVRGVQAFPHRASRAIVAVAG